MSRPLRKLKFASKTLPIIGIHHPEFEGGAQQTDIAASRVLRPQREAQPAPGILTVTLHEASGLSAAEPYKDQFDARQQESVQRQERVHWEGRSYRRHHRQWLPYAVLYYDHSHVFAGATAGTAERPIWAGEDVLWKFDVSRISSLTVYLYLKGRESDQDAQDILLGKVLVHPQFEEQSLNADWYGIRGGTGKLRMSIEYTKNDSRLMEAVDRTVLTRDDFLMTNFAWRKLDTQQLYALKTSKTCDKTRTSAFQDQLHFEIQSPFIAPLMFAAQSATALLLFAPFITGGHLFYYLQREQSFNVNRCRFYAAEICCALEYLHKLEMLCPWLRPKNVLVNSSGHVVIADLSLFYSDPSLDTNAGEGMSEYPAPEVLSGQEHSEASDWWTFAIFLHEMLTGLPAFYSPDKGQRQHKILSGQLELPATLDVSSKDLLSKLLDRELEQRLQKPAEIRTHPFFESIDWERVSKGEGEPVFRPPNLATDFAERSPPFSPITMLERFQGFTFVQDENENAENVARQQQTVSEYERVNKGVSSANPLTEDAARSTSIVAPSPSTTSLHPSLDGSTAWELIWHETDNAFFFYNSLTKATVPAGSRSEPSRSARHNRESTDSSPAQEARLFGERAGGPTQSQKEGALGAAIEAKNMLLIRHFLDQYEMNLNHRFRLSWQTPLEWATQRLNTELVDLLLGHGADPSFTFAEAGARAALIIAVEQTDGRLVEKLAPKTDRLIGTRALVEAVHRRDAEIVTMLLAGGVQCDFKDSECPFDERNMNWCGYGTTSTLSFTFVPPLVEAIKLGDEKLVRLLLEHGADASVGFHNLRRAASDRFHETRQCRLVCGRVIQLAMDLGRQDLVRLLLQFGANITLGQPVWPYHECRMIPRDLYLDITAQSRAAATGKLME